MMARGLVCASALLVAFVGVGWSTAAWAQTVIHAVTWSDLQGTVIESSSNFTLQTRYNGRERWQKVRGSWRIIVGPGQTITGTLTRENAAGIKTNSATFTLGRPQKFADGDTVWFFENGQLVNLRTFQAGGMKITYAFTRRSNGIACSVKAPFARERGAATIRRDAIGGPGNAEILSTKINSSTCRVSRR